MKQCSVSVLILFASCKKEIGKYTATCDKAERQEAEGALAFVSKRLRVTVRTDRVNRLANWWTQGTVV